MKNDPKRYLRLTNIKSYTKEQLGEFINLYKIDTITIKHTIDELQELYKDNYQRVKNARLNKLYQKKNLDTIRG